MLQDPVDPDLLFLGTEFGLYFSVDGGHDWTRFTAGLPTVAVMDMAFQERETDLVLATHGRSLYVIDDYSSLRQLSGTTFAQRLKILSTTPGQQYKTNPTASTRFTGSGEFRGENEPYGVVVTFVASGDDLPNPAEDLERARKIRLREAQAGQQESESDKAEKKEAPKVTVTVSDAGGTVLRTYKQAVHQGINRIAWGMQVDGVRPPPGPHPPEPDADLPPGPQAPAGTYRLSLKLGDVEDSAEVTTVADPRSLYTQDDAVARYHMQLHLRDLQEAVVSALERIDRARTDVGTLQSLIDKQPGAAESDALKGLKKQAGAVKDGLDELEKRFRTPPETKGIVYDDDKANNLLQQAQAYVGSSMGAPSPTAESYVQAAEAAVAENVKATNQFLGKDVVELRDAASEAGIGLLQDTAAVPLP